MVVFSEALSLSLALSLALSLSLLFTLQWAKRMPNVYWKVNEQKWSPECLHHRSRRQFGAEPFRAAFHKPGSVQALSLRTIGIPFILCRFAHLKQNHIDDFHYYFFWKCFFFTKNAGFLLSTYRRMGLSNTLATDFRLILPSTWHCLWFWLLNIPKFKSDHWSGKNQDKWPASQWMFLSYVRTQASIPRTRTYRPYYI